MRLREIRAKLNEIRPIIKATASPRNTKPPTYALSQISSLQEVVNTLDEIELFPTQIEQLKKQSFYTYAQESLIIQANEYQIISKNINELLTLTSSLITSLDIALPKEEEGLVSIKIPAPHTFSDIQETADTLEKIFGQTLLHKDIKGSVRIVSFDTGTYWIDMVVGGLTVLNVVGGLAYSAAVVFKKLMEGRLLQEQVKAMKLSSSAFKEIVDKCKEETKAVADIESQLISDQYYKSKEPEQIGRIKMAITELAELYSKGAEVYPAIDAAKEVIEQFPDFKRLDTIESKVKKIGNKK